MKIALLTSDGVYLEQQDIAATAFDPAVHVDASEYGGDCDLKTGKGLPQYRWNRELKRFDPVHAHQEAFARDMQRIIEFAAIQAVNSADAEIEPLVKEHFPAEHRAARLKVRP